jgi:predicted RNase H-like HicB family nuclease
MKSINDYTVVVMPDDDGWLAYVPAIDGCHAMGFSAAEARSELDNVFAMIAEEFAEKGRPWPSDVKELVVVRE